MWQNVKDGKAYGLSENSQRYNPEKTKDQPKRNSFPFPKKKKKKNVCECQRNRVHEKFPHFHGISCAIARQAMCFVVYVCVCVSACLYVVKTCVV